MISYKNLNRLYYVIACVITALGVYLVYTDVIPFLAAVLIFDVLFWCIGSLITVVIQKRERNMVGLMGECRIAEFIERYSHEYEKDKSGGYSSGAAIQLATAYMHLGDLKTSLEMLQAVEPKNPQKVRKKMYVNAVVECVVYHSNLSAAYIRCHEIEQTKIHMEKAREYLRLLQEEEDKKARHFEIPKGVWDLRLLQNEKEKKGRKDPGIDILERTLVVREIQLKLESEEKPDYEEDIKKLRSWIDGAENTLTKVYYHYLLYCIYRKNGDMDAAGECREFVKKNGGDTCYVQWVESGN